MWCLECKIEWFRPQGNKRLFLQTRPCKIITFIGTCATFRIADTEEKLYILNHLDGANALRISSVN